MGVRRYGFGPKQPRFAILGTQIPCWGTELCPYELTFNLKIENNFNILSLKKKKIYIFYHEKLENIEPCFFATTVELYFQGKNLNSRLSPIILDKSIFSSS